MSAIYQSVFACPSRKPYKTDPLPAHQAHIYFCQQRYSLANSQACLLNTHHWKYVFVMIAILKHITHQVVLHKVFHSPHPNIRNILAKYQIQPLKSKIQPPQQAHQVPNPKVIWIQILMSSPRLIIILIYCCHHRWLNLILSHGSHFNGSKIIGMWLLVWFYRLYFTLCNI